MKKTTQFTLISKLSFIFLVLFVAFGYAQVQRNFVPRFNQDLRGDVTIIANNMISRTPTSNYNGTDDNHDFSDNVYVDIDGDNTTFNSSSANFSNPEPTLSCVTIRKAYLYWAAADKEQDNGDDNQPAWNFNDVQLMLPGETTYTTLTADDIIYRARDVHFSNDPYVCVKDITDIVTTLADPYGKYQVANVEGKIGELFEHDTNTNAGTSGGWQIVFIYESPELRTKNVSIFDGYAHVTRDINNFEVNFSGFQTPPLGGIEAKVVIGSLEGDRDLTGDRLQIRDVANNFVDLNTVQRTTDNFFNSKITTNNTNFLDRNPASENTLGFDASVSTIDNTGNSIIDNNQTSATIRLTSNQETYGLFLLGLSVDVRQPDLYPINLSSSLGGANTNASDNIDFTFNVFNTGNDDAINVEITTTLPPQLEFISATLPAGITYTYDNLTQLLTFRVEDGLVDVGDPNLDVIFQVAVKEECYFLEESCDLDFDIQMTATYIGVENPAPRTTLSTSGLDTCELGSVLPVVINLPPPAIWATPAGNLDRTIECGDTTGLEIAQNLFPETDKCDFDIVKTSGDFVPNIGCGTTGTYTNTWTFTDACGRTIADYVQVITLEDVTPPVFDLILPGESTIECSETPQFIQATATDGCDVDFQLTFEDVTTDGACIGEYSITRTWTAVDACGNTATASQTINVQDTIPPVIEELPEETTIDCLEAPEFAQAIVSDSCSSPILTFEDVTTNGACLGSYTVTRTWTAIDACGNTSTANQIINIEDATPPSLDGNLEPEITVVCDITPELPVLEFIDNCSNNIDVAFNEEEVVIDSQNTDIVRTWIVTDECGNDNTFTQTVHMITEISTISTNLELCIIDDPVDLNDLIGIDDNGSWEGNDLDVLNGTIIDPSTVANGDYTFRYTVINPINNQCIENTDIIVTINDDCVAETPCISSALDVDISKLVTPNNDFKNETFNVAYVINPRLENIGVCDIKVIVNVYNRWGTRVFSSDNYANDWTGVAGGAISGEQLPTGTYYYVVELENSGLNRPIQGYILLGTEQ